MAAIKRSINNLAPNMCMPARSRILLLLLMGTPLTVCAQSEEPHARFSVQPSDPGTLYGVGITGEDFKFKADVTGARCYKLDYDDGVKENIKPDSAGEAVVLPHAYKEQRDYFAKMTAWSDPDCILDKISPDFELRVRVRWPPSDPQPPPSFARFTVAPSDPEVRWADFTFTADVSQAERYKLYFGDGAESDLEPDSVGEAVVSRYAYAESDEPTMYTATMSAWRNTGEVVEMDLLVSVQPPSPTVAVQFPLPVRPVVTAPREPATSDKLPWVLLVAAIALLASRWRLMRANPITFEPTRDRGLPEVIGAAVSMRVKHKELQFVISDDAVLLKTSARRDATKGDS